MIIIIILKFFPKNNIKQHFYMDYKGYFYCSTLCTLMVRKVVEYFIVHVKTIIKYEKVFNEPKARNKISFCFFVTVEQFSSFRFFTRSWFMFRIEFMSYFFLLLNILFDFMPQHDNIHIYILHTAPLDMKIIFLCLAMKSLK